MPVDESKRDTWIASQNRFFERRGATSDTPLKPPSGGGTSDGMESRVTALETHMEYVKRDLHEIDRKLDLVNDSLGKLATKSELKTWQWQWIATGVAIIALTVGGITGGLALIAQAAG